MDVKTSPKEKKETRSSEKAKESPKVSPTGPKDPARPPVVKEKEPSLGKGGAQKKTPVRKEEQKTGKASAGKTPATTSRSAARTAGKTTGKETKE